MLNFNKYFWLLVIVLLLYFNCKHDSLCFHDIGQDNSIVIENNVRKLVSAFVPTPKKENNDRN